MEPHEHDDPDDVEAHGKLPVCVECGRTWLNIRDPWQTYVADDGPVFYCPACAPREFGD